MRVLFTHTRVGALCAILSTTALLAQNGSSDPNTSHHKVYRQNLDIATIASKPATARPLPTTIEIRTDDTVAYVNDVPYGLLQSSIATTFSGPRPDALTTAFGDIRAINGAAAKGLYVNVAFPILATPDPSPTNGISISDSTRIATVGQSFDLQKADGTPIGGIFAWGFAFGPNIPGAPEGAGGGSIAIIGGTGPYIGVHGQMATTVDTSPTGPTPSVRFASAAESTAVRRINGGGVTKFLLQLFPAYSPDALMYDDRTALVFHTSDQSLVTATNPATSGESLTLLARNLGPTIPEIAPGLPFPATPTIGVNSPVDVKVNGNPVQITRTAGTPQQVNVFDITFVAPPAAFSGVNNVQIFVGYIGGVKFPLAMK
jgi:uncharacterized protein (TIGR03437 family)